MRTDRRPSRSWPFLALAAGLLVALGGAWGCGPRATTDRSDAPPASEPGREGVTAARAGAAGGESLSRPPVVLISIDTLRADRLPAYGYRGTRTPAIDALRDDAVLFAHAYSHAPLTLPSHASVFSGLWPNGHGVRDNLGYALDAARLPHLPSLVRGLGYRTGAAVSSFVLRADTGMGEGFEVYDDTMPMQVGAGQEGLQRRGIETVERALEWLDREASEGPGSAPAFLFVHLFEPHTPYAPPEPYASQFDSAYDAEIATADEAVGRLLDGLREREQYRQALILLFSDHGESLGEHGEDEHGIFVYPATQHVPLLVKLPQNRHAGKTVDETVQLVDLLPTVLDQLGADWPSTDSPSTDSPHGGETSADSPSGSAMGEGPESARVRVPELDGRSLLPLIESVDLAELRDRPVYLETYYPRLYFGWSELRSLVVGGDQYIASPSPELYDLRADPRQERNLLREERRLQADLRQRLASIEPRFEPPSEVDAATRGQLASLGYLGTARAGGEAALPAPATQIHLLGRLKQAHRARETGDPEGAARILDRVVEENPNMLFAWEQLARAQVDAGDTSAAAAALRRAFELSNGAPHLALDLGRLELAAGRGEEALALARAAHDRAPRRAGLLAARALAAAGRLEPALAELDRVAQVVEARPLEGYHQLRGDLLARLGRAPSAAAAFEREIELYPEQPRAYASLALLQATGGQPAAARATLDRLLANTPSVEAFVTTIRFFQALGDVEHAEALRRRAAEQFPVEPRFGADPSAP